METAKLANGAVYPCQWGTVLDGVMTLCLDGEYTAAELAATFTDPANTGRIEYEHPGGGSVYEGYTELLSLTMRSWYGGSPIIMLGQAKGERNVGTI